MERQRCYFKIASISKAWVESRGWGGSNYHLSAPDLSSTFHYCLLASVHTAQSFYFSPWHTLIKNHPESKPTGLKESWVICPFLTTDVTIMSSVWPLWWVTLMQVCCVLPQGVLPTSVQALRLSQVKSGSQGPDKRQALDLMAVLDETPHFHLYNNIIMLFSYRNDKVW